MTTKRDNIEDVKATNNWKAVGLPMNVWNVSGWLYGAIWGKENETFTFYIKKKEDFYHGLMESSFKESKNSCNMTLKRTPLQFILAVFSAVLNGEDGER